MSLIFINGGAIMADSTIAELKDIKDEAVDVGSNNLWFVSQYGSTAYKVAGSYFLGQLDGHGGIRKIEKTNTEGSIDTYTITYSDGNVSSFTVTNGQNVSKVTAFYGVSNSTSTQPTAWTSKMQTIDAENRYLWSYMQYKYSDGTYSTSEKYICAVYGDTGRGIVGLEKVNDESVNEIDTYRFLYDDGGKSNTFEVKNGTSVAAVEVAELVDSYTTKYKVKLTDGTYADGTITVKNGVDGKGAVTTVAGVRADSSGNVPLVLQGESSPTTETVGETNQLYFDTANSLLYVCTGASDGKYIWSAASVTVDDAISSESVNPVQNKVVNAELEKKQVLTENLTAETELDDADYFPYYDTSATANRKTLWSSIVAKIRTALFGTVKGLLRANGNGIISTSLISSTDIGDYAVTTNKLRDGAVTWGKLDASAKSSPVMSTSGSLSVNYIYNGYTAVSWAETSDIVFTVPVSIATGFEMAIFNYKSNSTKIVFAGGNQVLISGSSDALSAPTFSVGKYSTVAIKNITTNIWTINGNAEIVS